MGDISQFKKALAGGGARANQYSVSLLVPSKVGGSLTNAKFLCNATSLPGSTVDPTYAEYRGRRVAFVGDRTFQPWNISIVNDTDFAIHNKIEQWMALINNAKNNTGNTNIANYVATMTVEQLDRNDTTLKKYELIDSWPTSITPIQLSFDQNTQIETFQVQFEYAYFKKV
jgi:hypothetical protein